MKKIKTIFTLWFILFTIIFAYVAIFKSNIIWMPTEQTDIELWTNALEDRTEEEATITQVCLVLNSIAYIVNGIFVVLFMKEKSNKKIFVVTIIGTIFVGVIANLFVNEYLRWAPLCTIMLVNYLISTVLFLFLRNVKT